MFPLLSLNKYVFFLKNKTYELLCNSSCEKGQLNPTVLFVLLDYSFEQHSCVGFFEIDFFLSQSKRKFSFLNDLNWSALRQKGESQSTPNVPKNEHFLSPYTHTYVCVSGGKKCSFLDSPFCHITDYCTENVSQTKYFISFSPSLRN